jgi:hypothetical protein
MIETKILIGDIVELSPNKRANIDDIDLERCTVIDIDETGNRIKVIVNTYNEESEQFFNKESVIEWFPIQHVVDVERDYKVLQIADAQDSFTGQEVSILTMAKVIKQVEQTDKGYILKGTADYDNTDQFVYLGLPATEIEDLTGTTNRVSFAQYKLRDAVVDSQQVKSWQSKIYAEDAEDMFTMFDLVYPAA